MTFDFEKYKAYKVKKSLLLKEDDDDDLPLFRSPVTYIENPSKKEVEAMLSLSKDKTIRGVYDKREKKFYIWDAFDIEHMGFIQKVLAGNNRNKAKEIYGHSSLFLVQLKPRNKGMTVIFNYSDYDHKWANLLQKFILSLAMKKGFKYSPEESGSYYSEYLKEQALLTEKRIKAVEHRLGYYLLDPTADELFALYKRSRNQSLRGLYHDGKLYFWDGFHAIHIQFAQWEIEMKPGDIINWDAKDKKYPVENRINIDPFYGDEGTFIGGMVPKKYDKLLKDFANKIIQHEGLNKSYHSDFDDIFVDPIRRKKQNKFTSSDARLLKKLEESEAPANVSGNIGTGDVSASTPGNKDGTNDFILGNTTARRKPAEKLEEKFTKGWKQPHLINPTLNELWSLYKRSKYEAIRTLMLEDGTLYAWDAAGMIHTQFVKEELPHYNKQFYRAFFDATARNAGDGSTRVSTKILRHSTWGPIHKKLLVKIADDLSMDYEEDKDILPDYVYFHYFEEQNLSEKVVRGNGLKYYRNPTRSELDACLKNSFADAIRGIEWEGDLYVWDAYEYTHQGFYSNELGGRGYIESTGDSYFFLGFDSDGSKTRGEGSAFWMTRSFKNSSKWSKFVSEYADKVIHDRGYEKISADWPRMAITRWELKPLMTEKVENAEIEPEDFFAGKPVFTVPDDVYETFRSGKNRYHAWKKHLNMEEGSCKKVYEYAKKNPGKPIVVKNNAGFMYYVRPDKE